MNVIQAKDYDHMSQLASQYIITRVRQNPKMVLGMATGGTPVGTYRYMIEDHIKMKTSYKNIITFNLDEYVGLESLDPNSYRYFMEDNLFNKIDIKKEKTFIPDGSNTDFIDEGRRYEELIDEMGGIDLQLLGIGGNGHIGFNEPGTKFGSKTHAVELAPATRKANSRFFDSFNQVPTHAISMGIATIMKSKEILLLASGDSKREAIKHLLYGEITDSFPASILQLHPNITIIADEAALGKQALVKGA